MSDDKKNGIGVCSKCGATLTSDSLDNLCVQCQIMGVEDKIPEPETPKKSDNSSFSKFWNYARWLIIVICLAGGVYFVMSAHKEILASEKPIRNGSYDTNEFADQCIQNLWKAAALLQGRKNIPKTLTCPASGKPYSVTKQGKIVIVSCPTPGKHGCSALSVNSKTLIPEVSK